MLYDVDDRVLECEHVEPGDVPADHGRGVSRLSGHRLGEWTEQGDSKQYRCHGPVKAEQEKWWSNVVRLPHTSAACSTLAIASR